MNTYNFDELVLREFAFLLDHGFGVIEHNPTRIGYASDKYVIFIYYGHQSLEIGLEFGPVKLTSFGFTSLEPLVAVFDREAAERLAPQKPIETEDAVSERVKSLAGAFLKYVRMECLGSTELWAKVVAEAKLKFERRYKPITMDQFRARLLMMKKAGRFREIAELLEGMEDSLEPEEKLLLAEARAFLTTRH